MPKKVGNLSFKVDIDYLIEITKQAGQKALDNKDNITIDKKQDGSPVSNSDIEISTFLNKSLSKKYPNIKILCEESVLGYEKREKEDYIWIIDPIDGTKDYIKGLNEWTINIALVKNHKVIAGVVSAPFYDSIYYALKNEGAFLIQDGIQKQIFCNKESATKTILISNFHNDSQVATFTKKLREKYEVKEVAMSSSLKMCKIADGSADIHIKFNSIHEWDISACDIILSESGGKLLSLKTKKTISYNHKNLKIDPFIAISSDFDWLECIPTNDR